MMYAGRPKVFWKSEQFSKKALSTRKNTFVEANFA
jgi:hypothetical protein